MKKLYFVVTFHTTADAMQLEKQAEIKGVVGKLIPAPRSITPGCGMAFRSSIEDKDLVIQIIKDFNIDVDDMLDYEF